jgi:uncharacterized protein
MRTQIFRIIYLLLFALAIAVAAHRLPAYASRLPWLFLVALSDLYLMHFFSNPENFRSVQSRKLFMTLTLTPSILLLCFLLSMAFLSPVDWHHVVRTYLLGLVFFFYFLRFFPLVVLTTQGIKNLVTRKTSQIFSITFPVRAWLNISFGLSFIAGIFMILGMSLWVYDFKVVEKEIPVPGLPEQLDGFQIVHFSDLHLGRWHSAKPLQKAFNIINDRQPDLIAFTGDLVNYATSEALPYKSLLADLLAKHGVYAVLGNHDYGDYMRWPNDEAKQENIRQMHELMEDIGWIILENKNLVLYQNESCLSITGIANFSSNKHYPDRSDLSRALSGLADSCFLLLLTHHPAAIEAKLEKLSSPCLILAGHTHAMQFGMKISGRYYSPSALAFRHWGGLYELSSSYSPNTWLYVNPGLGHIAFPFRIGIKPEITILVLRSIGDPGY